jgi:hypothetical protein
LPRIAGTAIVVASTVGTADVVAAPSSDGPAAPATGIVVAVMIPHTKSAAVARQPISMIVSFMRSSERRRAG